MPVKIPNDLPAAGVLSGENIFVMSQSRAESQDIRPLRIGILNLMPTKIATETQLLRLLSNSPLQLDVEFLHMNSHVSKNTSEEHLLQFYTTFDEAKSRRFDGLIVTGAPVETLEFEEVDYWDELCEVMDWARESVTSSLYICWGAQAALHHMYGIGKQPLPEKCFGVFEHTVLDRRHSLMRGFDDVFYVPHSRHTTISRDEVSSDARLRILAESGESGVYIVCDEGCRGVFVTGHSEYDGDTLKNEYLRDKAKGLDIKIPRNYFKGDDPEAEVQIRWRAHSNLLYSNWLNYCVYQETPYVWE